MSTVITVHGFSPHCNPTTIFLGVEEDEESNHTSADQAYTVTTGCTKQSFRAETSPSTHTTPQVPRVLLSSLVIQTTDPSSLMEVTAYTSVLLYIL